MVNDIVQAATVSDAPNDPIAIRDHERVDCEDRAKLIFVMKREHRVAAFTSATPATQVFETVRQLIRDMTLAAKLPRQNALPSVPSALPSVVKSLTFAPNGEIIGRWSPA
jgi:hypothetical protein